MNEAIIALSLAYVVLAVFVLLSLIYSTWALWTKVALVIVAGVFYFVTYLSLERVLGWPTTAPIPPEFVVLSGYVQEPNKNAGEEGSVYLWVVAYDLENRTVLDTPRSHVFPYSPYLHEQVNAANKRMQRGNPQVGRVDLVSGPQLNAPKTWTDERIDRITLYDFPRQELPEK